MTDRILKAGLFALYISMASPAFAYLDGATGSMILQAVIGGAAAAMVYGRTYLARVKNMIVGGFGRDKKKG